MELQITLGYVYFLIENEWQVSKSKTHIFTYNQFGSSPLTLLNETVSISC